MSPKAADLAAIVAIGLVLTAQFLGVWLYGANPFYPWAEITVAAAVCLAVVAWVVHLFLKGGPPRIHLLLVLTVGLLGTQLVMAMLNPSAIYEPQFRMFDPIPHITFLPSAVSADRSYWVLLTLGPLLLGMIAIADLCRSRQIRRIFWIGTVANGALLVAFGLFQSLVGSPLLHWTLEEVHRSYFASYFYHGNAGAYINLVLPLSLGLMLRSVLVRDPIGRALWMLSAFVILAGLFVNTSRASLFISLPILMLLTISLVLWIWRHGSAAISPTAVVGVFIALATLLTIVISTGAVEKFAEVLGRSTTDQLAARRNPIEILFPMAAQAGLFGSGPGTFDLVFAQEQFAYNADAEQPIIGFWVFAHQDYLQAVIEWGWTGSFLWSLLIIGGMSCGFWYLARERFSWASGDLIFAQCVLAALLAILIQSCAAFPLYVMSLRLHFLFYVACLYSAPLWRRGR